MGITRVAVMGRRTMLFAATALASVVCWTVLAAPVADARTPRAAPAYADGLGIRAGKIKHVWLIILENKSYDATFTGLNNNTYLWRTLPRQGVLLENYYGTGHFSLDNYISMVSGQAPATDNQADCAQYMDLSGAVVTDKRSANFGQLATSGARYQTGTGCVYPADVPTLFNQLDA